MDVELKALTEQFFADMRETLDTVETLLLRLEGRPGDQESIQALFRSFHTLKGNAGLVGATAIQGVCHALESRLSQVRGGAIGSDLIQTTFEVLDHLRACAEAGDESSLSDAADAVARLASPSSATDSREVDAPDGQELVRDERSAPGHTATNRLGLETFRRVVAAFAPLSRTDEELEAVGSECTKAERMAILQTMGMAAIDLIDAVPEAAWQLRSVASYLEESLGLVIMSGMDYDPRRFGLIHRLVTDIGQLLRSELLTAPYLVSIAIDDAEEISQLSRAVEQLEAPSLIAVAINVPFDTLARTGHSLEQIKRAADHPRHTAFFVLEDEIRATQATRFLSDVFGRYPVVGTSVWGALVNSIVPEE